MKFKFYLVFYYAFLALAVTAALVLKGVYWLTGANTSKSEEQSKGLKK